MRIRNLVTIFSLGVLLGCASTPSRELLPKTISGIHQLEIVVFEGDELLQPTIQRPNADQAESLTELFSASSAYGAQLREADEAIKPLTDELNEDRTKTKLSLAIRGALSAGGITVSRFEVQPYGNSHTLHSLEERAISGMHGAPLMVLVPTLQISDDYRTVVVNVIARVYTRDTIAPAAEDVFDLRSPQVEGRDPIKTWSESDGAAFYQALERFQDQLGKQAMAMFPTS